VSTLVKTFMIEQKYFCYSSFNLEFECIPATFIQEHQQILKVVILSTISGNYTY